MNQIKKCSCKEHNDISANIYCCICNIYMCNKCETFHSKLFQNHNLININKNTKDIFSGLCKEEKHKLELEFYCKNHKMLCCAACISKIKKNEFGKHKDCDVCIIEDIKEEKEKQFLDNFKYYENFSEKNKDLINNLKEILEEINKEKEDLKLKIQQIFTKIRNTINNREDELMIEIDKIYKEAYFNEDLIKDNEKFQEQLKLILEKGKKIINEKNKIKLNELINEYINFENNVSIINEIDELIEKNKNNSIKIAFCREDEKEINNFLINIQKFGNVEAFNLFKSSILENNFSNQISILNWIQEKTKINAIYIKSELIFRMSENGESWENFHEYCDNKGHTLVSIETTKDKIFGGFTPLNWKKEDNRELGDDSNQTFIFSLNLNKKYDLIKTQRKAIRFTKDFGPIFGDKDMALNKNMKTGISFANELSNFLQKNNLELTGGKGDKENFETKEVEVFKINFIEK